MQPTSDRFSEHTRQALADPGLQQAFAKATEKFRVDRVVAFEEFPEGEVLRDRGRRIKQRTIHRLDQYLAQLADAVEVRGGHVHFALDAAEAGAIVREIARDADARKIIKSKSMTTEEIDLNAVLEVDGREVVETDLGEWILQLAGEAPSHIIAPAIHKTREDVTELFTLKLGSPRLERHEDLTKEARKHLRECFRNADMGITGVNFAVAETGTIAIVENEGNIRLTTSLPRVHVAVMGMEKVVPDLDALAVFLKILARSATGQRMSSYVSLITGPRREGEEDGPDAFHLVILDNGRSRLLADPVLREALYCIRCGACLNACPVYRHAGGHSYGWVYSGPIGAVISPTLLGPRAAAPLPFASTLCGACKEVCPVRIDLPKLLLEQRKNVLREMNGSSRTLARLFGWIARSPRRFGLASRLGRLAARPFVREAWWRPPGMAGWTSMRDFPTPPRQTFREQWKEKA